ncbi:MAG: hypothetical protein MJ144_03520, partial [Clostridia bacterium]|nr:hypothetical protein [Clostridia bacterium]
MNKNRRPFHIIIVMILTLAFLIFGVASVSYAITPWHTINMDPGDTYDVSKAKKNTTVKIDKSGTFTLTGTSQYCRVIIGSTNATVVLDNLNLDPGIFSYIGSRTASITINDQGGTVTLMSKEDTTNEFNSYLGAPAIRKDSVNTKLVFETSNPNNPGTINAYPNSIAGSVGIGCIAGKDNTAGNIVINSGIINASGTKGGAGIGAGKKANVDGITINGGSVKAVAPNASTRYQNGQGIEERGAGIGTTYKGTARNITINGGTVNAIGCRHDDIQGGYGEGAGIGGGSHSNAENITINGGKVYAHGGTSQSGDNYSASPHTGAAGIGGGADGSAVNIVINGGNIEAHGGVNACGIGTGSMYSSPLYSSVKITGGEVKAYADFEGTGIGSTDSIGSASVVITGGKIIADGGAPNPSKAFQRGGGGICVGTSQGNGTIAISGGYIQASGSKYYSAIGGFSPKNPGGWYKTDEDFTDTISISGGTIEAKGGDESISAIGGIGSYAVLK